MRFFPGARFGCAVRRRTRHVFRSPAYDAYAWPAFDAHAVDYLLKPYSDERFEAALKRAMRLVRSGASESLVERMHELLGAARPPTGPGAESSRGNYLISVSDIRWIAAEGV
ncbi:MAG: hypothetical protein HYR60_04410 [Acidobacteria bacterium]|nr:hypothetical protein [Acidobacteriota bacterium]